MLTVFNFGIFDKPGFIEGRDMSEMLLVPSLFLARVNGSYLMQIDEPGDPRSVTASEEAFDIYMTYLEKEALILPEYLPGLLHATYHETTSPEIVLLRPGADDKKFCNMPDLTVFCMKRIVSSNLQADNGTIIYKGYYCHTLWEVYRLRDKEQQVVCFYLENIK